MFYFPVSQWLSAGQRLADKGDPYNTGHHAHAWINALVAWAGVAGAGTAGAAALGASLPMLTGIVTAVGAGGALYGLGQSLKATIDHKLRR